MLKLSALQPHLAAAEALNQHSAWAKGERSDTELVSWLSSVHGAAHHDIVSRLRNEFWLCQTAVLVQRHEGKLAAISQQACQDTGLARPGTGACRQ